MECFVMRTYLSENEESEKENEVGTIIAAGVYEKIPVRDIIIPTVWEGE